MNLKLFKKIYNDKRYLILSIFLLSVFCSIVFLVFLKNIGPAGHKEPPTDYLYYYEPIADNFLEGRGLTFEGSWPHNIAPGFPVILSAVFFLSDITGIDRLHLITVMNVILIALASCFLFLIAKELFNKKIGLIASFLWMSYPFNLWFTKNPHTEVPFIPFLYLGIFLYITALKKKSFGYIFLSGLFFGLAANIRLIGFFLPFFLVPLSFFFLEDKLKFKMLLVLTLLIGVIAAILPWAIHAYSQAGVFMPLSKIVPLSIRDGVKWLSGPGEKEVVHSKDILSLLERLDSAGFKGTGEGVLQFFGREFIQAPTTFLKLAMLKMFRSWYATSSRWYETETLLVQLVYLISAIFGLVYIIRNNKEKIKNAIILSAVICYFWAITFFAVSIMRYMIPAMGLVIIFSAVTINIAIKKLVKNLRTLFAEP